MAHSAFRLPLASRSALRSPVRFASMHVLRSLFLCSLCFCMLCGVGFFFIFLCSLCWCLICFWICGLHHGFLLFLGRVANWLVVCASALSSACAMSLFCACVSGHASPDILSLRVLVLLPCVLCSGCVSVSWSHISFVWVCFCGGLSVSRGGLPVVGRVCLLLCLL